MDNDMLAIYTTRQIELHLLIAKTYVFCNSGTLSANAGRVHMSLIDSDQWSFSTWVVEWVTTNPFHPSSRDEEAKILGLPVRDVPIAIAWHPGAQLWGPQSFYNEELDERIAKLVNSLRRLLESGADASEEELERYELLSVYRLYCEFGREMDQWIEIGVHGDSKGSGMDCPRDESNRPRDVKTLWGEFLREHENLFQFNNRKIRTNYKPEHLFACFFVFRRAFYHIFFNITGTSKPITKLRCRVWESIVTHDLLGWMQGLHERMKDIPTLITGPSGTGKERVAEAIGRSLYIPFDKKKGFEIDFLSAFQPVNLSALSPTLIESELFGHVEGAFNNARDRIGRLESCPGTGAVFLDEIGELPAEIQVKLLRVLQTRRFQRVGENKDREFGGKVIAATNRDLAAELQAGRFREDFYYRLCADHITTPSLSEQLEDSPQDLLVMVEFVCRSIVGKDKAESLAQQVVGMIQRELKDYTWPGNFRELEQCVRSYTIRKEYHPAQPVRPRIEDGPSRPGCDQLDRAYETLTKAMLDGNATYPEIEQQLFTLVRQGKRTDKEAALLLGCDPRTLKIRLKATIQSPADDGMH
jgi:transcriptional regulator with AAA-type ATPase domain